MRTPYIVGNWKMNTDLDGARDLAYAVAALANEAGDAVDVGIAPPAIWLLRSLKAASDTPLHVYAQNAMDHESGAFTGEISPGMLASAGVYGVILGHSERRNVFGEDEETIGRKVALALDHDLAVILCCGEKLEQREAGDTWKVVKSQLEAGVAGLDSLDGVTIAYEPVWAIGTGVTATPEQAQEVHAMIRAWLAERFDALTAETTRIQYGGSVKPGNAAELLAQPDIDGALVGGASLKADSFGAIISAA